MEVVAQEEMEIVTQQEKEMKTARAYYGVQLDLLWLEERHLMTEIDSTSTFC